MHNGEQLRKAFKKAKPNDRKRFKTIGDEPIKCREIDYMSTIDHRKFKYSEPYRERLLPRKMHSLSKYEPRYVSDFKLIPRRHPSLLAGERKSTMHTLDSGITKGKYSLTKDRMSEGMRNAGGIRKRSAGRRDDNAGKLERRKQSQAVMHPRQKNNNRQQQQALHGVDLRGYISQEDNCASLHDLFLQCCSTYLQLSNADLSKSYANSPSLKQSTAKLSRVYSQLSSGSLSPPVLLMMGLYLHANEQDQECIRLLAKIMDVAHGDLWRIQYDQIQKWPELCARAYYALASSYKNTKNYLCGISALDKFQLYHNRRYVGMSLVAYTAHNNDDHLQSHAAYTQMTINSTGEEDKHLGSNSMQIPSKSVAPLTYITISSPQQQNPKLAKKANLISLLNADNINRLKKYSSQGQVPVIQEITTLNKSEREKEKQKEKERQKYKKQRQINKNLTNYHSFTTANAKVKDRQKSKEILKKPQRREYENEDNSEQGHGRSTMYDNVAYNPMQSKVQYKSTISASSLYTCPFSHLIASVFLLRARLHLITKNYQQAIKDYHICIQSHSIGIQPQLELASLYYRTGQTIKAVTFLETLQSQKSNQMMTKNVEVDLAYIRYHKALIWISQEKIPQSIQLLNQIHVKCLQSEVSHHLALLHLSRLTHDSSTPTQLQTILLHLQKSIEANSSQQYVSKSGFWKIMVLVFEGRDYYGGWHQIERMKKRDTSNIKTHVSHSPDNASNNNACDTNDIMMNTSGVQDGLMYSRISKIYESNSAGSTNIKNPLQLMEELLIAILSILKHKLSHGLSILAHLTFQLGQLSPTALFKMFGRYHHDIMRTIWEFRFYGGYVRRQYSAALKWVVKLLNFDITTNQIEGISGGSNNNVNVINHNSNPNSNPNNNPNSNHNSNPNSNPSSNPNNIPSQITNILPKMDEAWRKDMQINKLMLQCMILMEEDKPNYALAKIAEIEESVAAGSSSSNGYLLNNIAMVKAVCYILLYCQLQQQSDSSIRSTSQSHCQILLSAQELLHQCLISDKQNALIFYLLSSLHYELQQYPSALKNIRLALQYSDDHMLKHYFIKGNIKCAMGKWEESIKDYTNAIIVWKEQIKEGGSVSNAQEEEEYYQQKQIWIQQIYLGRAIAYLKYAYMRGKKDGGGVSSREKAAEDLIKFYTNAIASQATLTKSKEDKPKTKSSLNQLPAKTSSSMPLLMLFLHTPDPSMLLTLLAQHNIKPAKILSQSQLIKLYYLTKELNNCINTMRSYIFGNTMQSKNKAKESKESKEVKEQNVKSHHSKESIDLKCLQALKLSSGKGQQCIEKALIELLELTQDIYAANDTPNIVCGQVFQWADLLFFIGVLHFHLNEPSTALKYFLQSLTEKSTTHSLVSLQRHLTAIEAPMWPEQDELFQNRVYCKEQMQYNVGICYLMEGKWKEAEEYLGGYEGFSQVISQERRKAKPFSKEEKHQNQKQDHQSNQFISQSNSMRSHSQENSIGDQCLTNINDILIKDEEQTPGKQASSTNIDITPFPTRNRLCSIYPPTQIGDVSFSLAFCLPKIQLPSLGIFHPQQMEIGDVWGDEDAVSQVESEDGKDQQKQRQTLKQVKYPIAAGVLPSALPLISLLDLQMKPLAPWIRHNASGVIFTDNLIDESIIIQSSRLEKKKEDKKKSKGKKDRYQQFEANP